MDSVISELREISNRLESIEDDIREIQASNRKIDSHVDFVNGVYDKVRRPFHYFFDTLAKVQNANELRNKKKGSSQTIACGEELD